MPKPCRATRGLPRLATLLACVAFACTLPATARAVLIDFESPAIAGTVADIPGDSLAAQGIAFRTVRLSGTVGIGAVVTLAPIADGLRIYRDASAISGRQGAGPAQGGGYNDLLMRFDRPLRSLSLTSDDMVETPNPLRLIALAATETTDRFRVVDFVEAFDDAIAAPGNLLALAPSASFDFALFEVRNQQEGFDDLSFAFAAVDPSPGTPPTGPVPGPTNPRPPPGMDVPAPSSLSVLAGLLGGLAIMGGREAARRRRSPAALSPAA
ncbi:MAG: hypothetical protein ACK51F_11855 [Rhodospirillales bacterium]|jgi:hypothetical protein